MTEESQNEEGHIDLNKYEGHSKGPWYFFKGNNGDNDWWILDANNEVILKCGSEPLPADYLIADAPLLLEEVKRLQRRLMLAESALGEIRAYHESGQGNLGEIIEHYQENEQVEMPNAFDED